MTVENEQLRICDAKFLPIVAAYAERIGLVEIIESQLNCKMEVSPGRVVLAMILDALAGRSPLFRMNLFFADKETELLLGEDIPVDKLKDHTLGRVLERIADAGTNKILGAVVLGVMKSFDLDLSHVHHDTTSHTVFGDYLLYEREDHAQPFVITNGFSKDHRPDLKQIVHSLLCVDHGIPIYSKLLDGNESDKNINKNLIPEMVKRMRDLGRKDFIYVADSALVTEKNLALIDDWDNGFLFVSRLPMTYNECRDAIAQAVEATEWDEIGPISAEPAGRNRKPASYRAFETIVTLHGINYRAVVVHSDAHDERRRKKVTREIEREQKKLLKMKKEWEKIRYACLPDARAAAERIGPCVFREITARVEQRPVYHSGRPLADGSRRIKEMRYGLSIEFQVYEPALRKAEEEAGCFVLLSNTLSEGTGSIPARELLSIYKDQHAVESNFALLKDPVFVNSLFLKCPRRIEALGLVLILALLIWRLMERTMRRNLNRNNEKVQGWNNRETSRPTSLMMTTFFVGVFVIRSKRGRHLASPLNHVQLKYLALLEVSPAVFTHPPHRRKALRKNERRN